MLWLPMAIGICSLLLDRLTKYLVEANMQIRQSIPVIKNIFHITFHTNDGAAWSLFSGKTPFLILSTFLIIAALVAYIIVKKPKSKIFGIAVSLILSGAIGNLIDRIIMGSVIDFLDLCFISFPIFNVADICVVFGAILFCVYIFKSTDENL